MHLQCVWLAALQLLPALDLADASGVIQAGRGTDFDVRTAAALDAPV